MINGKTMTTDCMMQFIKSLGRSEIYDELALMKTQKRPPAMSKESFYLKGVCTTLVELGYDEWWVAVTFQPAFKECYMNSSGESAK